ncbi:MAG: hypothetical protein ACX939_13420, partial [Hyphococcus sp.]
MAELYGAIAVSTALIAAIYAATLKKRAAVQEQAPEAFLRLGDAGALEPGPAQGGDPGLAGAADIARGVDSYPVIKRVID